jgi:hypothetical protein
MHSAEARAMKLEPTGPNSAPFSNDWILGPMTIWPPANGFVDRPSSILSGGIAHTAELADSAICLPDLSGEDPFA